MTTPVSFPLAKLLKEKGFEGNYFHYWNRVNYSGEWEVDTRIWDTSVDYIEAPTISDVVMWLYKKHKIWISVDPENDTNTWFHTISHGKSETVFGNYSSLTEAYEAGIEDVLINMI
jgi:hypothetical protein